MRTDVKAAENVPKGRPLDDYSFGDNAYYYLDKMVKLCEENDVELILVKAPALYPYWYDEWDATIVDYAKEHNLAYYNFLADADKIGIDFSTDTYDGGLHLNYSGATKLSKYFGNILSTEHNVPDRRGDEALDKLWADIATRQQEVINSDAQN